MLCNKLVISSLVLVLFLSFGGSNAAGEDELASTISSTNTTYDLESTTYEYQYDAVPTPDRRDLKRVFNAESKLIRNDIIWYDNKGKSLKANRCGSISKTKINGLWYMVGSESSPVWNDGGDIYLYKSASLGSSSWQRVRKIVEFNQNQTSSSCNINQRYDDPNTVILHCRKQMFISHNGVEGDYSRHILDIKSNVEGRGKLKVGGSSMFRENDDLYLVTSRLQKEWIDGKRLRWQYIYKLNSTWTGVEKDNPATVSWLWDTFEAPYIAKKDDWYYLFASRTQGWKQSTTWYRRARSLELLATAIDSEVVMHPANTPAIQSMGSQFCFLQQFDDGKWLFGGRRHPAESPENFAYKYGKYVMAPATFIDGTPHVYWKYYFDWTTYDYTNPDFDTHYHFGFGHKKVPCLDSTEAFWLEKAKRPRFCSWASKKNTWNRCQKHREMHVKCPVTCKVFGCGKDN